jgi:hypothetical protein
VPPKQNKTKNPKKQTNQKPKVISLGLSFIHCTGIPLIVQLFIALLPDHMARPLAAAHDSVKAQT